jgi:hypothetical protein
MKLEGNLFNFGLLLTTQSKSSFMIFFAKYQGRVLEPIYIVSPLLNPKD